MVALPVVAPSVTTYASHTPYLTLAEWLAAPTALDVSDLIQGGTTAQQNQAVQDAIERASSWVDRICHQVLAATTDTHSGRYLVNRWGNVKVPLPRKPILEVSAIAMGNTPSSMNLLASLVDVDIGGHGVIEIPAPGSPFGSNYGFGIGSRPLVRITYVNGYPNTTMSAASAAATNIVVASALGIYPGSALTIYDSTAGTEHITVSSSYTTGSTTIPLVGTLAYAHTVGMSVSNLPPVVKQAAILLTSALIQTRGDDAVVLDTMDTPTKMQSAYGANADAERLAEKMLADLVRVR
jgi:hypothetical protein